MIRTCYVLTYLVCSSNTCIDIVAVVRTYVEMLTKIPIWRFRSQINGFEAFPFIYILPLLLLLYLKLRFKVSAKTAELILGENTFTRSYFEIFVNTYFQQENRFCQIVVFPYNLVQAPFYRPIPKIGVQFTNYHFTMNILT